MLVQAEAAIPVSVCSPSDPASTNLLLPTVPTSADCTRSREACVQRTSDDRVIVCIWLAKAVARVFASGIPHKTKLQTDWTVRVWSDLALVHVTIWI